MQTKALRSGYPAFHRKPFEMGEHFVDVQHVGIFVMQIAGSFIASPAAVMELAASPANKKAAALHDLIFQSPNSCHNTNAASGAIAGEG
jgi:hypothetical protein